MAGSAVDKNILNKLPGMNDNEIVANICEALMRVENANEIHQFHAAKALNGYIDQIVRESCELAEEEIKEQ